MNTRIASTQAMGAALLLCLGLSGCTEGKSKGQGAADLDLVILGGRVMDPETNFDAVANVGIKDGQIAVITPDAITGAESIDASGHVVAPGWKTADILA